MSAYKVYLETQKAANAVGTLANASTALTNPSFAYSIAHGLGGALKGLGTTIKGDRQSGFRSAVGGAIKRFGGGAEKLGEYSSDVAHGLLNAGPGIEYDAGKLPVLLGFESRIGAGKKTKLTAQRGLFWAGNAAMIGKGVGEVMKGPEKQAHEDAAALISFWENSV